MAEILHLGCLMYETLAYEALSVDDLIHQQLYQVIVIENIYISCSGCCFEAYSDRSVINDPLAHLFFAACGRFMSLWCLERPIMPHADVCFNLR